MPIRSVGPGTHFAGPLLGSPGGRLNQFAGTNLGVTSNFRGPYAEYLDRFQGVSSITVAEDVGFTETVVGTAASRSVAYDSAQQLLVHNADTVADEGSNLINSAAGTADTIAPYSKLPGVITSTATLMDNREIIFGTRVGFLIGSGTDWSSKWMFGWNLSTDVALMTPSTGAIAIGTGGGVGFHITEAGQINAYIQGTTAATEFDTGQDMGSLTTTFSNFLDLGVRVRWIDASAGTGVAQFYVNGQLTNEVSGADTALPMQSTQGYCLGYELVNGPATADAVDAGYEYLYFGISRPGLTYPYTTGLNL